MPIYEYQCSQCEKDFEEVRPSDDRDKPIACPQCGSDLTHRCLSFFATSFSSLAGGSSCSSGGFS
jgi:putative FmdB family regulatory protein